MNQGWLQSLLEGFDLIQNRVRKVLKSEAIEPIDCLGLFVDPERMIVIEITDTPDWPPQTVIEELRRGYTWNGRILRLAEVRAVRGQRIQESDELSSEADPAGEVHPTLAHTTIPEASGENGSRSTWLETE